MSCFNCTFMELKLATMSGGGKIDLCFNCTFMELKLSSSFFYR